MITGQILTLLGISGRGICVMNLYTRMKPFWSGVSMVVERCRNCGGLYVRIGHNPYCSIKCWHEDIQQEWREKHGIDHGAEVSSID
jgi:endogenous inhibitor of DNA gyrase (YacG/DUF329 family)